MSHRCFSGLALFVTIKSWQPCAEAKKVFTYICIIGKSKKVSLLRGSNNGGCWGDLPVTFSFLIVIILCDFWPGNSFLGPNKLAKPQRCVSQVHFVKLHFGNWSLLLIAFGKYIAPRGLRTLCNGPETPTQWKSESVTDHPTYWLG